MSDDQVNPDSAQLSQADEPPWAEFAKILLWKLAGREKVTITQAEITSFYEKFEPAVPVMFARGRGGTIDFQIIDEAQAKWLAEHDASMRGSA